MTQKGKLCDWLCVDIDSGYWKLTQWHAVNFPSTHANTELKITSGGSIFKPFPLEKKQ